MDIAKVLAEYDALEATHDFEAINNFLDEKLAEAKAEGDTSSAITLYNEIIGFNREISDYAKSITACRDLLITLEEAGLNGTVSYATCLLNIANACRAAGLLQAVFPAPRRPRRRPSGANRALRYPRRNGPPLRPPVT